MPSFIIKLSKDNIDYYMEWSTVVDAPVTYGMSLEEFTEYYKEEYGNSSMDGFNQRMERVKEKGTSSRIHDSADEIVEYNRAGENEKTLTKYEIVEKYCINRPKE